MTTEIFAQLSNNEDQTPFSSETYTVQFNTQDQMSGIGHSVDAPTDLVIEEDGVYMVVAAGQVGRRTGSLLRHVDMWLRKNDGDIVNSGVRSSAPASLFKGDTNVLITQNCVPCKKGDVLQVIMSVSELGEGLGLIAFQPEHGPVVPSIILTMYKI